MSYGLLPGLYIHGSRRPITLPFTSFLSYSSENVLGGSLIILQYSCPHMLLFSVLTPVPLLPSPFSHRISHPQPDVLLNWTAVFLGTPIPVFLLLFPTPSALISFHELSSSTDSIPPSPAFLLDNQLHALISSVCCPSLSLQSSTSVLSRDHFIPFCS
jgi:hypothetical protein